MTNKKIASEVAIGIILLLAIVVGGVFWLQTKSMQTPVAKQEIKRPIAIQQQPVQENGQQTQDIPESQQQAQSPKAGYKIVQVNNPTLQFSFEVPEKWLTETRNSGEKQLTLDEMKEFLATSYNGDIKTNHKLYSDYQDISWKDLSKMKPQEVKDEFFKTDDPSLPFPAASVAAGDHIWYTDTSWQQIDFYVLSQDAFSKTYLNEVYKNKKSDNYQTWSTETVDGMNAEVVTFATDNGQIDKGGTGGKMYFMKINDGKNMFVINKQARPNDQFENDFANLISTFKSSIKPNAS